MKQDHPLQLIVTDEHGIIRFKKNELIDWMVGKIGLNDIARHDHSQEDYDQLLQLIGYSVSGAPISAECRARVDAVEQGKPESFREGFIAGKEYAVQLIDEACAKIRDEGEDL